MTYDMLEPHDRERAEHERARREMREQPSHFVSLPVEEFEALSGKAHRTEQAERQITRMNELATELRARCEQAEREREALVDALLVYAKLPGYDKVAKDVLAALEAR